MGANQSTESDGQRSSPEELSHLLAERFASKCFTPLELTHLKDNFYSRALDQGGLRYWNEETLSRFLEIPDGAGAEASKNNGNFLDAGPVIFRMVSYLGAFPFQSTLAPSVLTFDAIVKVVVLLTERYGRVWKRGGKDRIKLLFGSLADVGRKPLTGEGESGDDVEVKPTTEQPHATGFSIDEPANDEEEEDDDDLALAALESLDAIEVFKHDQRIDRTVYEARISVDTFRRLLTLLLVLASLHPLGTTSKLITQQGYDSIEAVRAQVDSILATFGEEASGDGISYRTFSRIVSTSLPFLFDPLTPLFDHLLFSKNLDLSRKREPKSTGTTEEEKASPTPPSSPSVPPIRLSGGFDSNIFHPAIISHLSFFLPTSYPVQNFYRNGTRFHPVFSSTAHGESLTAFSHHVLTWQAPSLLLLNGVTEVASKQEPIIIGAYLPEPWKQSAASPSHCRPGGMDPSKLPYLFQLSPTHTVLRGSPSFRSLKSNMPVASFSTKTGIALGCIIPPSSRTSLNSDPRPSGGGSLKIDFALENATFITSDGLHGEGVFLPPGVSPYPSTSSSTAHSLSTSAVSTSTSISIHTLEVWGIVPSETSQASADSDPSSTADAIAQQRVQWNFEAREAERRRTIHLNVGGGDSEEQSGRALLEMAGIIGDHRYAGRKGS